MLSDGTEVQFTPQIHETSRTWQKRGKGGALRVTGMFSAWGFTLGVERSRRDPKHYTITTSPEDEVQISTRLSQAPWKSRAFRPQSPRATWDGSRRSRNSASSASCVRTCVATSVTVLELESLTEVLLSYGLMENSLEWQQTCAWSARSVLGHYSPQPKTGTQRRELPGALLSLWGERVPALQRSRLVTSILHDYTSDGIDPSVIGVPYQNTYLDLQS